MKYLYDGASIGEEMTRLALLVLLDKLWQLFIDNNDGNEVGEGEFIGTLTQLKLVNKFGNLNSHKKRTQSFFLKL